MSLPATTAIEGERSCCVIKLMLRTSSTNLKIQVLHSQSISLDFLCHCVNTSSCYPAV